MSTAIKETEFSEFQRLSRLDCWGHLAAINENEFVIMSYNIENSPNIWKYNVANDEWKAVMNMYIACRSYSIPGAVFHPSTGTLHLAVHHREGMSLTGKRDLQSIDTEQWKVRKGLPFGWPSRADNTPAPNIYRIILAGDEIHSLYDDEDDGICRHFVVHKVSGDVFQESAQIHPKLMKVNKAIFIRSRSSIVLVGYSKMGGQMIVEYSKATKQWEVWDWKHKVCYYGAFVAVMDGRYILSVNGYRNKKLPETDLIMIHDLETKQCVKSELKLPEKCERCQAVLLSDQSCSELLTVGFVKRCYKAEEFRNMLVLPSPLITLIGKCLAVEYVHLLMKKPKQSCRAHYRVNVADILKCVLNGR